MNELIRAARNYFDEYDKLIALRRKLEATTTPHLRYCIKGDIKTRQKKLSEVREWLREAYKVADCLEEKSRLRSF